MATYPATNTVQASELLVDVSNQMHEIVNEDAVTEVNTESGPVPSVRKALADTFLFVEPVAWDSGNNETAFNQLRTFNDNIYWSPTATLSTPVPMGATPIGDSNWKLAPVGSNTNTIKGWDTAAQEELLPTGSKIYPEISTLSNGDTVPSGTTHLRVLVGGKPLILAAWDDLVLPAVVQSVPVSDNGLAGYDVVTDQGSFEFVSIKTKQLRDYGDVTGWGAVGDGVADDTAALIAAGEAGVALVFPYKQTFKVTGSTNIVFNHSVDFNSCTLDLTTFTGKIHLKTNNSWTNYASGSNVVTELQTQASVDTRYYIGWVNTEEVAESFVKIKTNQAYYSYRGNTVNRTEFNVMTRFGQALSTVPYALTTSTVTSVDVLKINKYVTTYKDVNFKIGSNDVNNLFVHIEDATRLRAENFSFECDSDFIAVNKNPTWISCTNSYGVIIDGLHASFPSLSTATTGYTYNLSLSGCYDITIKRAIGQGDGWGATGSNSCQRVVWENCELNRIDFHNPFLEYMKVKDCQLGSWGILCSAIGDLEVTSCTFNMSGAANVSNCGIIRSRGDTGGFCTGNLTVRDCVIDSNIGTYPLSLCTGSSAETPPAETPLEYYYWKNETYDNIESIGSRIRIGTVEGLPSFMRAAWRVNINNVRGNFIHDGGIPATCLPAYDLASNSKINDMSNRIVSITNTQIEFIGVIDNGNTARNYKYTIDNVSNTSIRGVGIEIVAQGHYNITNSELEGIDSYSAGAINVPATVIVAGNKITHTGYYNVGFLTVVDSDVIRMTLRDNVIRLISSVDMIGNNRMAAAYLVNNEVYYNGDYIPSYPLSSSTSFTLPAGFDRRNKLRVITGYDSDNSVKYTHMSPPRNAGDSTVAPIDETNYAVMTASTTDKNDITITVGSAVYKQVSIIVGTEK
ncbi:hypothetical protein [Vibrio phage vB_VibM_10AMN]|uniref:Putative phage tail fibre N-terminal domain-containing protein n=1 Tax=Staphylococcus phage vB_VibM_10AMN12 TaxID=3076785 RepID=A0AA96KSY8_9CAUD|nr:hypothetical protein [Vibrio phage vB_VibM_10AMN]WNO47488.1 hypothetical protein [Staphylococcus phage vB_VibM_10AMN12]